MRLAIGIITYGESTAKYLPYFLASLEEQTTNDFTLLAYDNSDDGSTKNRILINNSKLELKIFGEGKNLGFGKAYNVLINYACENGADYFLALNPDMIFDRKMVAKLTASLSAKPTAAAVVPKILRWDFPNLTKTKIIDSLGIVSDKYFRFFDDQQGRSESTKPDSEREIFGFTGAAVMLRLKALQDVRFRNEFFDELMFMYKEDCDLSLRLRLADWKLLITPDAIAYHDRTAAIIGQNLTQIAVGRKLKSQAVKRWSFLNQLILLYKFQHLLSWRVRIYSWTYELLSIGFAVIFETYLLAELITFFHIKKQIKIKSQSMPVKINSYDLDIYFK